MDRSLVAAVFILSLIGSVAAYDQDVGSQMQQSGSSGISPSAVSKYAQYYKMPSDYGSGIHITAPKQFDIKANLPATVFLSYQMQAMPYTQYQTYATYTGGNSLWIQGSSSWTQYARVPQGSSLSLIATSSTGINGNLYEIHPDGKMYKNTYYFYPGYNQIDFYADSIGQHVLLLIIGGQVSNSIVVDVTSYSPPSYQQPVPAVPPAPTMPPVTTPSSTYGDTPVTIVSQGMRGYQVFLDGTFIGTEGVGGDPLDGRFSFSVVGNQNHDIRVYDGQFNYPKTMFFQKGFQNLIYVEPGTTVYV
jgi:hypothetical protein